MVLATPDDFYDHMPEPGHATGDIWCGLPSYGTLKQDHVAGIVITPACDLQNSKSETITYLPIVPFDTWFATFSMLAEIRGATQNLWTSFRDQLKLDPFELSRVPTLSELTSLRDRVQSNASHALAERIEAGVRAMEIVLKQDASAMDLASLSRLFGERDFVQRCERLITNALRSDTHFLPARGRWAVSDQSFSSHSLVMFRYPLTAPLDLLDLAAAQHSDWGTALSEYASMPVAKLFAARQPLRVARLRPRFFADLLSRYTALYARVGSPDFPPKLVSSLVSEIRSTGKAS